MIKYFPGRLLGTSNQRRFVNQLEKLFSKPHMYYGKKLTYPYTFVTDVFKDDLPWTKDEKVKTSVTKWLLDVVLDELVNTFYITENTKSNVLYFHKWDWSMIKDKHMKNLANEKKLVQVEEDEDIVGTRIRFLPSGNKLRMLMPFQEQIAQRMNDVPFDTPNRDREMTLGKLIGKMCRQVTPKDEHLFQTNSRTALYRELEEFMKSRGQVHAIKCDIKSCYDQLDLEEVIMHNWNRIKRTYTKRYIHAKILWDEVIFEQSDEEIPNTFNTRCIRQSDVKDWLMRSKDLKIMYKNQVCTFNFVPHSLVVSNSAVNNYLQILSQKFVVEELEGKEKNFKIFRYMDDMVILSENIKLCEEIVRLLTQTTRINKAGMSLKFAEEKTVRSGNNEPILIAGISLGCNADQIFFTPSRVATITYVRNSSVSSIPSSCLNTIKQLTKCRIGIGFFIDF